jgi:hypothetical protein
VRFFSHFSTPYPERVASQANLLGLTEPTLILQNQIGFDSSLFPSVLSQHSMINKRPLVSMVAPKATKLEVHLCQLSFREMGILVPEADAEVLARYMGPITDFIMWQRFERPSGVRSRSNRGDK